jgi:uncharacterized protein YdhG (YjbR/CyaY superfamily)
VFPIQTQKLLQKLRLTIHKIAPKAEEVISYGMPAFKINGSVLVYFAGYKAHIGFYPTGTGIAAFKKEIAAYKNSKGAVQFPLDKPLPLELIKKMVKFKLQENTEKAELKKVKKTSAKKSSPQTNTSSKNKSASEPIEKSDPKAVSDFIKNLDPIVAKNVQSLRHFILSSNKQIGERIKWNNPSFFYTGKMKPFDPKEYKREIAVFNLHKNRLMLVLPSGAKIKDTGGLLEGDYKDGRRLIIFKDEKDIKSKALLLQKCIRQWIERVDE